jgi:tRNA splicing endonuclease
VHSETENQKLAAQVKALQKRVRSLEHSREDTRLILEAVAKKELSPEKLAEMKSRVPEKVQSAEYALYQMLKDAGFEVKPEQRTAQQRKNKGYDFER